MKSILRLVSGLELRSSSLKNDGGKTITPGSLVREYNSIKRGLPTSHRCGDGSTVVFLHGSIVANPRQGVGELWIGESLPPAVFEKEAIPFKTS